MTTENVKLIGQAKSWSDRVPLSTNPWRTFGDHLVWFLMDIIASDCDRPPLGRGDMHDTAPTDQQFADDPARTTANNFWSIVEEIRVVDARLNQETTDDWSFSTDVIRRCRSYLATDCVSLLVSCSSKNEFAETTYEMANGLSKRSRGLLGLMIDETRHPSVVAVHDDDLMRWLGICEEFAAELKGPKEVTVVLDTLQDWLSEADRFADFAGRRESTQRSPFRPLPDDLDEAVREIEASHRDRLPKAQPLPGGAALAVIKYIAESENHKTVSRSLLNSELENRGASFGDNAIDNVSKALYLRGYARLGNPQGFVDDDVRLKMPN